MFAEGGLLDSTPEAIDVSWITAWTAAHDSAVTASSLVTSTAACLAVATAGHSIPLMVVAAGLLYGGLLVVGGILVGQNSLEVGLCELLTLTRLPLRATKVAELVTTSATAWC